MYGPQLNTKNDGDSACAWTENGALAVPLVSTTSTAPESVRRRQHVQLRGANVVNVRRRAVDRHADAVQTGWQLTVDEVRSRPDARIAGWREIRSLERDHVLGAMVEAPLSAFWTTVIVGAGETVNPVCNSNTVPSSLAPLYCVVP